MATPVYDSSGAFNSVNGSGSTIVLSVACPATINAGDFLLLIVGARSGTSVTLGAAPSGWTAGPADGTAVARIATYYKIANGTEDGSSIGYTFTFTGALPRGTGVIARFTGTDSTSTVDIGTTTVGDSASITMPEVTTTKANSLAIAAIMVNNALTIDAATGESGGDWVQALAEGGTTVTLQIQTATMTSIGSITGGTATVSASIIWRTGAIAISEPAQDGGFPFSKPPMLAHHILR